MKHFSLILNLILLVAVGLLYYFHFSTPKKSTKKSGVAASQTNNATSSTQGSVIAYVEMDSLNNKVTYIKNKRKELEVEQKVIMSDYENAYKSLEAEKNNFLKKGDAITQQEAEEFQQKLMYKQQQVENNKQVKGQKLAEKGAQMMENMQTTLKDFLDEYNQDKKYTYIFATGAGLDYLFFKDSAYNITNDIIQGLNEKMKPAK